MGDARLRMAERKQVELLSTALDDLIPADHWVRLAERHVASLDLSRFTADVRAVDGRPGRDATDPKILLTLWIVALSEGIGSARRLAELTTRDVVYKWICGGVTVNRDMLARFRAIRGAELDELLSQTIAAMMDAGLVTLTAVAQDGAKVRASAGAGSFRRKRTLERFLEEARAHVARLKKDLEADGTSSVTRQDAARSRAAEERLAAMQRALAEMPKVEAKKAEQRKKGGKQGTSEPRVSTTDPDARVMKMGDGGFRPAFNPQFATDVGSNAIVGVVVTNEGTDARQLEPMLTDILDRTGELPTQYLADGGYVSDENIEATAAAGIEALLPVRQPRTKKYDPHTKQPGESEEVGAWRERMGTDRGKVDYKARAATAERTNAELRKMGLTQLAVRGMTKVTSAVLLMAVAYNIGRMVSLMG
jgi:transposase